MSGKKKRWLLLLFTIILLIGGLVVWKSGIQKEVEPEYVFLYADNQPQDYPTTLGGKYFAKLVEERTGGRIRILVYAEGALGTETEVLAQLKYGGIDFTRVSSLTAAEHIPEMNVLSVPYLYTDAEHMWKVLDGEIGDQFLELTKDKDMVGLSWYDAGVRNFYSAGKPITCLEDMQGMKIRVQESSMMQDTMEALGAEGIQLDYEKVYSSFERGLIDAAENNWPSYESMFHYEVAEYYTLDEHTRVPELQLCSKYTWEVLSEEDREIIAQCARESAIYERKLWGEYEDAAKKSALANGTKMIELSTEEKQRFQEAVQPIYEKYCGEYMDIINSILELGQ